MILFSWIEKWKMKRENEKTYFDLCISVNHCFEYWTKTQHHMCELSGNFPFAKSNSSSLGHHGCRSHIRADPRDGKWTVCSLAVQRFTPWFLIAIEKTIIGSLFWAWIMMCQLPWRSRWLWRSASSWGTYSNLEYPWATYVILSNFCHFFQLVLSTHSVFLINFCRIIKLLSSSHPLLFTHFLRYLHPMNVPAVDTTEHNSLSRLVERTPSAPTQQASLAIVTFWCGGIAEWLGLFT